MKYLMRYLKNNSSIKYLFSKYQNSFNTHALKY